MQMPRRKTLSCESNKKQLRSKAIEDGQHALAAAAGQPVLEPVPTLSNGLRFLEAELRQNISDLGRSDVDAVELRATLQRAQVDALPLDRVQRREHHFAVHFNRSGAQIRKSVMSQNAN